MNSAALRSAALFLVLVGLTAGLGLAVPARWSTLRRADSSDPATVDHALVLGAAAALLVVAGWAALVSGAALLEVLGSARATRVLNRCCPRGWRPVLAVACGVAAAVGAPAYADGRVGGGHDPRSPLTGLPSLDRPEGEAPGARPALGVEVVPVRPGDSLWRIEARRHPSADAAELVGRVDALYRANRAVIGADPDRIVPGQRLRVDDRAPTAPRSTAPSTTPGRRRG